MRPRIRAHAGSNDAHRRVAQRPPVEEVHDEGRGIEVSPVSIIVRLRRRPIVPKAFDPVMGVDTSQTARVAPLVFLDITAL